MRLNLESVLHPRSHSIPRIARVGVDDRPVCRHSNPARLLRVTIWQCPIRATTGIPCPGCGLSSAMVFFAVQADG